MNEDDFEDFEDEDNVSVMDAAPDTITVRGDRTRRSWRDIERFKEQREIERLNTQDNWYDELDRPH
ncbi:MAG: hypothetical protein ACSHXK_03945 [Oceanococcus sp.]